MQNTSGGKQCYNCGKLRQLAKDCQTRPTESKAQNSRSSGRNPMNQHVSAFDTLEEEEGVKNDPTEYLYSDSEEEQVRMIQVTDKGSDSQYAEVSFKVYQQKA